jgi:hypothetical protein
MKKNIFMAGIVLGFMGYNLLQAQSHPFFRIQKDLKEHRIDYRTALT